MTKEHTLICPNIATAHGKTKQLVDELIQSWRRGENEGASEIAAIADLLSTEENLPDIAYRMKEGGAVNRLVREFATYLSEMPSGLPGFAKRFRDEAGLKGIPFHVGALGSATGALYASLADADVAGGEVITKRHHLGGRQAAVCGYR